MCSYVCPHAILRPMLLTEEEVKGAPEGMKDIPAKGKDVEPYRFHIAVSTLDCTGCGSCANVCPVGAMEMSTLDKEGAQKAVWDYTAALPEVRNPFGVTSVKNSQFNQPLLVTACSLLRQRAVPRFGQRASQACLIRPIRRVMARP